MRLVVAVVLIMLGVLPAVAQRSGETRQYFKDWLAACRVDGYCSATAYQNPSPGNGTVADYVLRVGRHAEGVYWEISFSTVATMGDAAQPFEVAVDGEAERFAGSSEVAAYGSINDFFLLGQKAQAVMDRLAPGAELTVAFTDTDGNRQEAVFSLAGLTASLIWIDEQQNRLGSERVAEAPPVGLTPASGGRPTIPEALVAHRATDTDCLPMSDIVNADDIETGMLDGSYPVWFVPCWAGAYNFSWKVYVERFEGEYAEMAFPEVSPTRGWTASTQLVNYGFDAETQQVSSFSKGRGLGDCGTSGLWQWDGFVFRLVEFRAKEDCDGGDPGEFPLVFPAP